MGPLSGWGPGQNAPVPPCGRPWVSIIDSNTSTEWLDRVLFSTSHRTLELLHDGYILVGNTDLW